jgi:hypothetical protein
MYSLYYQARIDKTRTWQLVATLRSFEHVAFDRTIDKEGSLLEFFVTPGNQELFLAIMHVFEQNGLVCNLVQLPNRFQEN